MRVRVVVLVRMFMWMLVRVCVLRCLDGHGVTVATDSMDLLCGSMGCAESTGRRIRRPPHHHLGGRGSHRLDSVLVLRREAMIDGILQDT